MNADEEPGTAYRCEFENSVERELVLAGRGVARRRQAGRGGVVARIAEDGGCIRQVEAINHRKRLIMGGADRSNIPEAIDAQLAQIGSFRAPSLPVRPSRRRKRFYVELGERLRFGV